MVLAVVNSHGVLADVGFKCVECISEFGQCVRHLFIEFDFKESRFHIDGARERRIAPSPLTARYNPTNET